MCGMRVVPVRCDELGNVDVADLKKKAEQFSDKLAALMITYPSTHGVFEDAIVEICDTVHSHGGQVYMDCLPSTVCLSQLTLSMPFFNRCTWTGPT